MIAIIDYDAGNMRSVEKALTCLNEKPVISRDLDELKKADKVILPGVGAYVDCMNKLKEYNLIPVIEDIVHAGKPFLGICLGMQLMFESSEETIGSEDGESVIKGLGLLKGKIKKIPSTDGLKIPHMGWNSIKINPKSKLLRGISDSSYVYFVHSYYLDAEDKSQVAATTEYGVHIDAAVEAGNLYGCQFHPEKSSDVGLQILKNFITL